MRDQARERKDTKPHGSGMTLDDGSNSSDAEKTLTLDPSLPHRSTDDAFATASPVATPGKPSAIAATKIAAVLAVALVTLLVIWLTRR